MRTLVRPTLFAFALLTAIAPMCLSNAAETCAFVGDVVGHAARGVKSKRHQPRYQ